MRRGTLQCCLIWSMIPTNWSISGAARNMQELRRSLFNMLADWALQYRQRATWSEERNIKMTGMEEQLGVIIGYWDEKDAEGKDPGLLPKAKTE